MSNLEFPRDMSPEDSLRFHRENLVSYSREALEQALDRLLKVLEENPDIDVRHLTSALRSFEFVGL